VKIRQKNLSSECWMVQIQGLGACKNCPYRGTTECGGKNILKTMKNIKGRRVPLRDIEKENIQFAKDIGGWVVGKKLKIGRR